MPYLGKTPSQATRKRYYKTASVSETSISGTMTVGGTLTFTDGEFVDVSVNGVALVAGTDYNTDTANTIAGLSALSANDQVEIVVYDTFSVFSGDVDSNMSVGGNLSVTGTSTFSSDVDLQGSAGATLKLTSTDTTGADTELLGQIDFVSSDTSTGSTGTQARIKGVYEDNGDSSGLEFFCGASTGSGTPTLFKRMILSHDGEDPAASIITDDNVANLALISTDTDAGHGPRLNMVRNPSEAGADGDNLGQIFIQGYNDAGTPELIDYFQLFTEIADASDGTEDARQIHYVMTNGSQRSRIEHTATETVINEDSVDVDFRVESDVQMASFFVEGSTGNIGIGHNTPTVDATLAGTSVPSGTKYVHIHDADGAVLKLSDPADGSNRGVQLACIGTTGILNNCEGGNLIIGNGNTGRMTIDSSGQVSIGSNLFIGTTSFATGTAGTQIQNDGFMRLVRDGNGALDVGRLTNDGELVKFRAQETEEGSISVSGTSVGFNGGHLSRWSRMLDGSKPANLLRGTVMSNLDDMIVWSHDAVAATVYKDGDDIPEDKKVGDIKTPAVDAFNEDNEQLNHTKISDTEGDVNVAGVFVAWDNGDTYKDYYLGMTGDMVIRISKNATVTRGDLLMSAGDGTAKPQGDDIVRSKTIAKVTSITKSHTYDDGSYLVPCVLMAC